MAGWLARERPVAARQTGLLCQAQTVAGADHGKVTDYKDVSTTTIFMNSMSTADPAKTSSLVTKPLVESRAVEGLVKHQDLHAGRLDQTKPAVEERIYRLALCRRLVGDPRLFVA
jgi:hypothetical protein